MIVIDYKQFHRLMYHLLAFNSEEFNQAIKEQYGIERIVAKAKTTTTSWDIYFIDDRAELMFKLKHSEYL